MDFQTKRLVNSTIWWIVVILFFIVIGFKNEQLKRDENNGKQMTEVQLNNCVRCYSHFLENKEE